MSPTIPGKRDVMQTLSDQVRDSNPADTPQSTSDGDTTTPHSQASQPLLPPPPTQLPAQKLNPSRKAKATRAATKAQNPAQDTDLPAEGANEIGSTSVPEPSIPEHSRGVLHNLGASHVPGGVAEQLRPENDPPATESQARTTGSTMDNLVAKLIQAQEEGKEEMADRYFKLIEMLTTKQPDPRSLVSAPQQTIAVVPTKRKSLEPDQQEVTEVRGLKFIWGVSNDHDEIGFVPYFHKNIMEMRGIIPITIFNRKWQEEALAYHAQYRPKEENSNEKGVTARYTGKPYPEELRQTHSQWTINHACARVTLKRYGYDTLVEWLAIHVENCEQIRRKNGFMVALRYDVRVRRNAIAFRAESEGNESLSDFSDFKPQTAEEVYAESRNFNELGYGDINPYAKGEVRHAWNPVTGTDILLEDLTKQTSNHNASSAAGKIRDKQTSNLPAQPIKQKESRLRGGYRGQHYDPDYNRNRSNNNYRNGDQSGRGGPSGGNGRNEGNGNRFRD
ncbi:hypothetical protein PSTT_13812 [Puccinia striiformis]|uniref:Uncharacterized protein n=1 Tax=Puccinia striiformis TaxID=27350 RepID=A0A2S4UQ29_9BASI|nr:hypothetical protein PSTT_13812 [Puccinia striiformis]